MLNDNFYLLFPMVIIPVDGAASSAHVVCGQAAYGDAVDGEYAEGIREGWVIGAPG